MLLGGPIILVGFIVRFLTRYCKVINILGQDTLFKYYFVPTH